MPPAEAQQRNRVAFRKALSAITAPATATVPNIGQLMHLVTVIFPTATTAVSNIDVRIEASFDGATWLQIAAPITAAPRLAGTTYQVQVAYGPYPFIRVRCVTAAATPMDVWYSGQTIPAVSAIQELSDRFLL